MFLIQNLSKCVTGIFSLVMGDYVIRNSGIIAIDVHCESGYRGSHLNDFTLDRLISSTWNYNGVHLTKLVWLWNVDNFYRDAVSIYCTVYDNISDK